VRGGVRRRTAENLDNLCIRTVLGQDEVWRRPYHAITGPPPLFSCNRCAIIFIE
jgi:hypothetical protein